MTLEQELIDLTRKLLSTIAARDWESYAALCDPTITCFEPEARGHLVAGLEFHRFYFELGGTRSPKQNTLVSPHVRILGSDAGIVSYVRLVQVVDSAGNPQTVQCEESRVWESGTAAGGTSTSIARRTPDAEHGARFIGRGFI